MSTTVTAKPLPPVLYNGPIISKQRSKPTVPAINVNVTRFSPSLANLQRRPHTRRLPSLQPELPSVSEEDETELTEADSDTIPIMKPRRRPRPAPLIPPRTYPTQNFPLIVEIPTPIKTGEQDRFSLSPSTLFARRRSETVLDFPVPPISATPPRLSPTPSLSSSSSSKSPYPRTPHTSDSDSDSDSAKYSPAARRPYRSASVLSLRSFSTIEFDMQAEPIYALLHTSPTSSISPKPEASLPVPRRQELKLEIAALRSNIKEVEDIRDGWLDIASDKLKLETSEQILPVLDTAQGGYFEVPFVLGSFMEGMSSDEESDSQEVSDGEGIEFEWDEEEQEMSFGDADCVESSDEEEGAVDPIAIFSRQLFHVPFVVSTDAPSPSVYSVASYERHMVPPRESIVPCDVFDGPPSPSSPPAHLYAYPGASSPSFPPRPRAPSPRPSFLSPPPDVMSFRPSSLDDDPFLPPLRSRFSSSTLASIPDEPTSFFARLTGKASSTSKRSFTSKRSSTTRHSQQSPSPAPKRASSTSSPRTPLSAHRHFVPPSPAISAFSFSTQAAVDRAHTSLERDRNPSRSSLDSYLSNDSASSTSSNGRRRPPIPIELFLRR